MECNEINQTINQLKMAFNTCGKINFKDLDLLVDLVAAVNKCNNGGSRYNTLVTERYEGPAVISVPVNKLHSYTLAVLKGTVTYDGFVFPRGTTRNVEFTTLNQTSFEYVVSPGGLVMFEYLIEDIDG